MSRIAISKCKPAISAVVAAGLLTLSNAPASGATACADLVKVRIAPNEIGLPSGGASISSAEIATVPADPKVPNATREFCKVLGAIAPVDPNAPPVNFEVNLPLAWNGKALQMGGGALNGNLVNGLSPMTGIGPGRQPVNNQPLDLPPPVARGFATWGTDSGHNNAQPGAFALNDEALVNFAYAAYKKTHDAGRRIALAFYDRPPAKIYYLGGSEGGREGLVMAQRFPADFDGILSAAPALNWSALFAAFGRLNILQQNGGWPSPTKVATLRNAVSAACDAMDGLADGVISAYEKCIGTFDPKTLRCPNGADTGDACLSDAQIATVEAIHRPSAVGFALANGVTSHLGWNYGSEDQRDGMVDWVTGEHAPQPPSWGFGTLEMRYFFARDPKFDPLAFSTTGLADRFRQISALMDATNPDLSAFAARGGKLILKAHGADFAVSPFEVIDYYKAVVAKMGQANADSFMRFYVTPGVSHRGTGVTGSGAAVPNAVDLIGVLDDWADGGNTPGPLVQVAQETKPPFKVLTSRPMCRYPLYPRYRGRGDPKAASSFTCANQ